MIDRKTIQEKLGVDVALTTPMIEALTTWTAMYENKATWLGTNVKSMNLAAGIASEIARSVTIEMEVELGDSDRAKYLAEQFKVVLKKMRDSVEYSCAKGGLIFKPYPQGENILVDIVQADHFYPTNYDSSGNILAAIFVDQRLVGKHYYTRLEQHDSRYEEKSEDGTVILKGYLIRNKAYKAESHENLGHEVLLSEIEDWKDLEEEAIIENVDKPLFAYFKYPLANNIDPLSPLGVSCFSRAVELIEEADKQWSRFLWENESAERAVYIDTLALARDTEGKPKLPNKRLYRLLELGSMEGDFFKDWTPDIRDEALLAGLDAILKRIEFTCGLAYGTISDPNTIDKTATEIKMSKQRSAATIVDTQKALEEALNGLFEAMDNWADLYSLAPTGKVVPVYKFDDSIIVDKDAQFQQDLQLESRTIMGKVEFRVRNFKEDEETATEKVMAAIEEQKLMYESEEKEIF